MGVKSTWSISRKTAIEYLKSQDEEKVLESIYYWLRRSDEMTKLNLEELSDGDLALILEDVLDDEYKNFFVCDYELKRGDDMTVYNINQLIKND